MTISKYLPLCQKTDVSSDGIILGLLSFFFLSGPRTNLFFFLADKVSDAVSLSRHKQLSFSFRKRM